MGKNFPAWICSIAGALFCALVVVWASSAHSQNAGTAEGSTIDLDQLLQDRDYLDLEKVLSSKSKLNDSDRAFFEGVMANRRNRVAESIRTLEPLVPALSATNKERAVIALSTLADDYEKSFRYSDAADTYTELEKRFGPLMDEHDRQRASTRGGPVESVARRARAVCRGEGGFHRAGHERQGGTSRGIGRDRQVSGIDDS